MTQNRPSNARVLELLDRDFTSKSTIGLIVDVLRGNLDVVIEIFANEKKEERWRSNNDLYSM
jgi:hypothetical protein